MKSPYWAKLIGFVIGFVIFELVICWIGVACWNYTASHWLAFVPQCPTMWLFFVGRHAVISVTGRLPESYWKE